MAKFDQGDINKISGKIGPVVMTSWLGIQVMRSRPARKKRKPTPAQQQQRRRFEAASHIARFYKDVISIGYQPIRGQTPVNAAISHILTQVMGPGPFGSIDNSQLLLARGILKKCEGAAMQLTSPGQLRFSWINNTGSGNAQASDQVVLVASSNRHTNVIYSIGSACRADGQAGLDVTSFVGSEVCTWLFFRSKDGERTADSVYTGKINLPL